MGGVLALSTLGFVSAPANALSVSLQYENGENARLSILHRGKPITVDIVAIDRAGNELTDVTAFPSRMKVTGNAQKLNPRTSFIRFPENTYAVCAKSVDLLSEIAPEASGTDLTYRACVALGTETKRGRTGPALGVQLGNILSQN